MVQSAAGAIERAVVVHLDTSVALSLSKTSERPGKTSRRSLGACGASA